MTIPTIEKKGTITMATAAPPEATPTAGRYAAILADPPWRFKNYSDTWHRGRAESRWVGNVYSTMSVDDVCRLDVASIAAEDAVLFLWATYPCLLQAFRVIDAWGFEYKAGAFTWVKQSSTGRAWHFGMGFWTRGNAEMCLLATRGRPHRLVVSRSVPELVVSPRREHSRKPDEVRDRIVELFGDVPRIELFARDRAPGWAAWGNEVESDIELPIRSEVTAGKGSDRPEGRV